MVIMFALLSIGQHHVSTKYKIAIIFDSVDKLFTQMILHRQTNIFFPFARYFFYMKSNKRIEIT